MADHDGFHPLAVDIEGEGRLTRGLGFSVELLDLGADQFELPRILERRILGHRHAGGAFGKLTEAGTAIACPVSDNALRDLYLTGGHAPFLGRGSDQHRTCRSTRLAHLHIGIGHGGGAAGPLHAKEKIGIKFGIRRCRFGAHL